jgi:hypothetical protein
MKSNEWRRGPYAGGNRMLIVPRRRVVSSYSTAVQDVINRLIAQDVANGDSSGLETAVQDAIAAFIDGLIADGQLGTTSGVVSTAGQIQQCYLLAGAKTRLAGTSAPVLGAAPTLQGTTGGWSYSRKQGVTGNGTNNYMDTNRNNNIDSPTNCGIAVYLKRNSNSANENLCGFRNTGNDTGARALGMYASTVFSGRTTFTGVPNTDVTDYVATDAGVSVGASMLIGLSRSAAGSYTAERLGANNPITRTANASMASGNIWLFGQNNGGTLQQPSTSTIAFYAVGKSLNLTAIRGRLNTYLAALAAAIP